MSPDALLRDAAERIAAGDRESALRMCEAALAADPGLTPAHQLLSAITLPGPYYTEVLAQVHTRLRPGNYLEVGVASGKTIALAAPSTRAVGVDPEPRIGVALGPNVRIVRATSDAFFAKPDEVRALFAGAPIELAFVDGMHLFEFALRDFAAIERLAAPAATILLHDCYPLDRRTAERVRQSVFWSGDCWRLVLALKKYRPDLSINTVATAPTGLTVVRNLDPASSVLTERMDDIVAEFRSVDYSVLHHDKPGMLNLFPNQAARIDALLAEPAS